MDIGELGSYRRLAENIPKISSENTLIVGIFGFIFLVLIIAFLLYLSKKKRMKFKLFK